MRKLVGLILIFVLFNFSQVSIAAENSRHKILVLPDNIQFESTNYLVFPDASIVFASDFINEFKKVGNLEPVSTAEIRDALRKDRRIAKLTHKALKEYKYNYNVSFVDLKAIAKYFNTDLILLVTSQTDTQNYLFRRTIWDFLNIPGTTPIDPMYKLSTYVTLLNVNDEYVIWDRTFYKKIASMEGRIIPQSFAPATVQLRKIKAYSDSILSPLVVANVEAKILPPAMLPQKNDSFFTFVKFKTNPNDEKDEFIEGNNSKKTLIQKFKNTSFYQTFSLPQEEQFLEEELELKPVVEQSEIEPKIYIPKRQESSDFGVMMNAL